MKNKILVYDDNCPMCKWYSGLFVKYGFLQADARKPLPLKCIGRYNSQNTPQTVSSILSFSS